ncbi:MAG: glycosyltransferase [Candidatus Pacearchaeota archaeon]|jgi:glycosyltransferase involved in cell wall biosynthesis
MDKKVKGNLPSVSIIIPTYNEEEFIERCLEGLTKQNYPKNRYEIIVVDNISTDKTISLIRKFSGVKLLKNPIKNAEISKKIGLKESKGELIYFGDADVIIEDKDWLKKMTLPFIKEKNIFASECKWGVAKDFTIINKYCALLGIADPLARMLSKRKPYISLNKPEYFLNTYKKNQNPVLYCVIWKKKSIILANKDYKDFNEGRSPMILIAKGYDEVAYIKYTEAYHYYSDSLNDFINKRKKIAKNQLRRKNREGKTWIDKSGNLKVYLSGIYCFSIILPFFESIKNIIRDKDYSWIVHPIACFVTAFIYGSYFVKDKVIKK